MDRAHRHRRGTARAVGGAIAIAAAILLLGAPRAPAAEIQTWKVETGNVNAAAAKLGSSATSIPSVTPHDAIRVNVMLPDGYDGAKRYPVLYLLHPYAFGYDYWASPEGGDILNTARDLGAIVVMPEGGRGYFADWWNGGRRGDPAWDTFVFQELIGIVESRLRILPGRRWHSIAGFSMGGIGAAVGAGRRPDYFGSAALLSGELSVQDPGTPLAIDALAAGFGPAIDGPGSQTETHRDIFGDPVAQEFNWAQYNPLRLIDNYRSTRLFVSYGNGIPASLDELAPVGVLASYSEPAVRQSSLNFKAAADAASLTLDSYNDHNGMHTSYQARHELLSAIAWGLFEPVPDPPRQWTYRTAHDQGRAWDLYFDFDAPPEVLVTLRRDGDRLSAEGAGTISVCSTNGAGLTRPLPFSGVQLTPPTAAASLGSSRRAAARTGRLRLMLSRSEPGPIWVKATVKVRRHRKTRALKPLSAKVEVGAAPATLSLHLGRHARRRLRRAHRVTVSLETTWFGCRGKAFSAVTESRLSRRRR